MELCCVGLLDSTAWDQIISDIFSQIELNVVEVGLGAKEPKQLNCILAEQVLLGID